MDISSKNTGPAGRLSNFTAHGFELDGVSCASMEGFLQSLKFDNPERQEQVCALTGFAAKKAGRFKNWKRDQILYWRGVEYPRGSPAYAALLDRAYLAMYEQCEPFRKALAETKGEHLTHAMGKNDPRLTVLTEKEFCSRLMNLRNKGTL